MFQRKDQLLSEWMEGCSGSSVLPTHPQPSCVSLHTDHILNVREQNGSPQGMPLKAGIAWHAHRVDRRRVHLHKRMLICHYFVLCRASVESRINLNHPKRCFNTDRQTDGQTDRVKHSLTPLRYPAWGNYESDLITVIGVDN